LPSERFVFEGFLPRKGKERGARLDQLSREGRTAVLFVSPHHLIEDLNDLSRMGPDRPLCVARELTKVFEEVQWTTVGAALDEWRTRNAQGEFTLVLGGAVAKDFDLDQALEMALAEMSMGATLSDAVRNVAASTGVQRRMLYDVVLVRSRETKPGQ
jgi:16S rRNA (cytidine1402-2'-O)-methyltransferase